MTEEAQRAALAALVHAISRLDTTLRWGEGRTSASDGQRFAMPRRSCNRPPAPGSATSPWSSLPSSPTTTRHSTARRSSAPTGTRHSCSTGSCTTRATWSWRSPIPTPTATRRSTSPRSRCGGDGSALASAASRSNASTALTSGGTTGRWPAWWAGPTHDRPPGHRRAVGPNGTVLCVAGERSPDRLGRAQTPRLMHRQEPLLPGLEMSA
jgi:hypothetical protein